MVVAVEVEVETVLVRVLMEDMAVVVVMVQEVV